MSNELPAFHDVDVAEKRALVRVDFNVPVQDNEIADDFRIQKTLPLIKDLLAKKTRIVLLSHLTERKIHRSFRELIPALERVCGMPIAFAPAIPAAHALQQNVPAPSVILLENLRAFSGEEQNDPAFAKELASLGEAYINEDFSQSHRPYASIVTLPRLLPSFAGPLFQNEIKKLNEALNPPHPFLLILGGVKFETKLGVVERFISIADRIFIGGALANIFFKAQGKDIGDSIYDREALPLIQACRQSPNIILPSDPIFSNGAIMDSGPETNAALKKEIADAAMVVWNGPLGAIEQGFDQGTKEIAIALAKSKAKVIVGGGDTVSVIQRLGLAGAFYHVSTGGGAMLTFLATGTLPAIEALLPNNG